VKIALSLFLLLFSTHASAPTPQVTGLQIVDYGIYTAFQIAPRSAPETVSGAITRGIAARLIAQTRNIPAQKGVMFGFRFVVQGAPAGAVVPCHLVTIFPSPLTNPTTHVRRAYNEYDSGYRIGSTVGKTYSLDDDWELVRGTWTL